MLYLGHWAVWLFIAFFGIASGKIKTQGNQLAVMIFIAVVAAIPSALIHYVFFIRGNCP